MKWLPWIWQKEKGESDDALQIVQQRFAHFLNLLDANNRVLKLFGDIEEKGSGDYLFDVNYIHSSLAELRAGVGQIIESMIEVGGADYVPLRERARHIQAELVAVLTGKRPAPQDDLTIPFERLDRDRVASVGSKNAQLGEIGARLGLPVPGGFYLGLGLQALHRCQRSATPHRPVHRAGRLHPLRRPGLDEREDPEPGAGEQGARGPGTGDPRGRGRVAAPHRRRALRVAFQRHR